MFPSNSNDNSSGYNLPINPTQSSNNNQQLSHFVPPNQNPNYSFFNFSHNLLYHDDLFLDTILPYQSPPPPPPPPPLPPSQPPPTTIDIHNVENFEDPGKKEKRKRVVVRKAGKKDRHSKIHTAHGPRDRRMRLSLQIARKFFDLQDMLGFDKASKTIEWLFNKSKSAIKDLAERSCSRIPSSPSLDGNNGCDGDINHGKSNQQSKSKSELFQKKVNREKARARARERTKEKLIMMQKQGSNVINITNNNNSNNPSCSENNNNNNNNNMEAIIRANENNHQVNEYGFTPNNNNHQQQQPLEEQMASVDIMEKFLTTTCSSPIFDFAHNDANQDRGLSRSMMVRSSDAVGYDDFPASWVSENARISASGFQTVSSNMGSSSANNDGAFMGRPFN